MMKYILEQNGMRALEALSFTPTLYAFDFDGTLAKIVENPSDAGMSRETEKLFQSLSKMAKTAVISGRGLQDLKPRFGSPPKLLIGNHGLEGLPKTGISKREASDLCSYWKGQVAKHLKSMPSEGIEIEDKGYSLAIHYRKSRVKRQAKAQLMALTGALDPRPRVITGKCVINLVPTGAPHKGFALLELMSHVGVRSAFYIGDDDTDEDVFSLPEGQGYRVLTVRVGNGRKSHANFFIRRQTEINRLLRTLLAFESQKSSHGR
jgi:trehalose 6-phosphate phosphatase